MKCANCGSQVKRGSKFCERCGQPVTPSGHRRNWKRFVIIALIVAIVASGTVTAIVLIPGGSSSSGGGAGPSGLEGAEVVQITTGKIVTGGTPVQVASQTVAAAGGTITVSKPGDPLNGMAIDVPAGSYSQSTAFTVSEAPISSTTFGDDFEPVSPLITVENGGGHSEEIMTVKVPVAVSEEDFAMAFQYDEETGELEGLPTAEADATSITYATTHFSKSAVFKINRQKLRALIDKGITIAFQPGKDDWQFPNKGSVIAPDGHCSGATLTEMWYFTEKTRRGSTRLNGLYDNNGGTKTPNFWFDDSNGYRLASVIQKDMNWESLKDKVRRRLSAGPQRNFLAIGYSLLKTGKPQFISIFREGGAHAINAYGIKGDQAFIADPNFPGDADRHIDVVGDTFFPYNSGSYEYNRYVYLGNWSVLVDTIADRWTEFQSGTIGNDLFPAYRFQVKEGTDGTWGNLTNDYVATLNKLGIQAVPTAGGDPFPIAVYRDGRRVRPDADGLYPIAKGVNHLGILVTSKVEGKSKYVDFEYVDVNLTESRELKTRRTYYDTGQLWSEWTYYMNPNGTEVQQGYDTSYYRDGTVQSREHYVDGAQTGQQEFFWENGNIAWRYEMKNDLLNGYSREYDQNGVMYRELQYVDGVEVSGGLD